ncbi:MAG: hypothetical protein ACXWXR_00990 [Candidatus Limnocylindrales bacterium]
MTESSTPPREPTADKTFTWTEPPTSHGSAGSAGGASGLVDSVRDVIDELAQRATPSVREFSARAAELAAIAADKAAPLAKRAGEVTADASGRLASMSRTWAADLRASTPAPTPSTSADDGGAVPGEVTPGPAPEADGGPTETQTPTA